MEIGKYHQLNVARLTDFGAFLEDQQGEEVLLPRKFVPTDLKVEDSIEVFIYLDNEERPTATTQKPKINLDEFALLKVADVGKHGAFLEWGIDKQLFVPFMEQTQKMEVGKSYVVRLYLDRMTDRLAASSKVKSFLEQETEALKEGEKVNLFIFRDTELGYEAIINHQYLGLLYHNEVFQPLKPGDALEGYIKKLREDDKIDLSLKQQGYEKVIDSDTEIILKALKEADGYLALHDKSSPADIYSTLKMSKKAFKRSIGKLYKEKQIQLEDKGIRLV
jgi:predicted RNA-binding protein (virulence factor B family)